MHNQKSTPPRTHGDTPWGPAQYVDHIYDGIHWVETAGHGGFWLSPARAMEVGSKYPTHEPWACKGRFAAPFGQWWEEDCDAAYVVSTFDDDFDTEGVEKARAYIHKMNDYERKRA